MSDLAHPERWSGVSGSRYRQAMQRGYRWLRFEPGLEREFREFNDRTNIVRIRLGAWLSLSLYALFIFIDLATLPQAVARITAAIRLFVIIPGFVPVLALAYRRRARPALQPALLGASMVTGLGTVAIIGVSLAKQGGLPYEGILLVALFVYVIACLHWWKALLANLVTLAAFVVMELLLQPDVDARFYQITFMAAANAVGAYGGYYLEYTMRTTFLAQSLLNELAERDGLTGLYNRRTLNERLDTAWRQAQREQTELAVAMIDVDHFKRYNDRYGHAAGDTALQAVAQVVAQQARRPLDLAARYGGEEFVVIWYAAPAGELAALGEQLREAVQALGLEHEDSECRLLTVSVGVAVVTPAPGQSSAEVLRAADTALYRAKHQGRNRVIVLEHPAARSLLFQAPGVD